MDLFTRANGIPQGRSTAREQKLCQTGASTRACFRKIFDMGMAVLCIRMETSMKVNLNTETIQGRAESLIQTGLPIGVPF